MGAEFVIRSMSTTDYRPAMRCGTTLIPEQKPQPYHIYLKPVGQRSGAYWANHIGQAMRFANVAEAQAEADRISLPGYEISAVDDPTTYWDNRAALRAVAKLEGN